MVRDHAGRSNHGLWKLLRALCRPDLASQETSSSRSKSMALSAPVSCRACPMTVFLRSRVLASLVTSARSHGDRTRSLLTACIVLNSAYFSKVSSTTSLVRRKRPLSSTIPQLSQRKLSFLNPETYLLSYANTRLPRLFLKRRVLPVTARCRWRMRIALKRANNWSWLTLRTHASFSPLKKKPTSSSWTPRGITKRNCP